VLVEGQDHCPPEREVRGKMLEYIVEVLSAVRQTPAADDAGADEGSNGKFDLGRRLPFDAEPGGQRRDRERQQGARAEGVGGYSVQNRQQKEVAVPLRSEEVPLLLDETDVGADQQRA